MHPTGQTGYLHPNTPHFPQMGASVLIGNTRIHRATSQNESCDTTKTVQDILLIKTKYRVFLLKYSLGGIFSSI